ncbi:MAG: IPT/TIG domain-containing protein [Dehalococcoidia bacterium]|nr:IPT/TIG domain-containing protein [Dehalococcoidia bacterium]
MKRSSLVFIALVLLLAFLPFAPAFATPASAQTISISPTTGNIGTMVTLTGSGFSGTATAFTISFAGVIVSSGTTASGTLSASFTVPSGISTGTNVVVVTAGTQTAFAYFEVLKGAITLSVSQGIVGSRVTVSGTRFAPNSTVTVYFDGNSVGARTVGANGNFSHPFTVPENPAGSHDVTAGTSSFDLTDAVQFEIKPSLSEITPTSGAALTPILVSGKGFQADDNRISIYLGPTKIGEVKSNELGTFATAQVGFGEFPAGAWELKATDAAQNSATADTKFTVKANMTITPTAGNVSTPVKVSGTGFQANASISLTLDVAALNPVGPIRTTDKGSFTGNFVMPKSKAGAHTVAITDGTNSLSFAWTMESEAPAIPALRSPLSNKTIGALSKQSPVFTWGEVTDPSSVVYGFQIAKDATFSIPVITKDNLTATTSVETLERGLYYWRVMAIDGAGNASAWATPWTVQIGWPIPIWALVLLALLALAIIGLLVMVIGRSMVARV